MTNRFVATCILATAASACGIGTGTGTDAGIGSAGSSVIGNLRGAPMVVFDTTSGQVVISTGGATQVGAIVLSSSPNICGNATANQEARSSRFLDLFVGDTASTAGTSTAPTAPGTYTVASSSTAPPAKFALAVYTETDATCQPVAGKRTSATSGTVTLTSAGGGSYTGTFDLTFDSGDHVTGTFTGMNCPGLQTAVDSTATTCI
jgi:hypothetical protein